MTYKIEAGIPMSSTRVCRSKYPFAVMNVGESFKADTKPASLRSAATAYAKREGGTVKFAVRSEGEGSRIWRVA
jgi:hypothetical protein